MGSTPHPPPQIETEHYECSTCGIQAFLPPQTKPSVDIDKALYYRLLCFQKKENFQKTFPDSFWKCCGYKVKRQESRPFLKEQTTPYLYQKNTDHSILYQQWRENSLFLIISIGSKIHDYNSFQYGLLL